jgi:hypothetical protein
MFITVLFTTAKIWKQTRCPTTDEWTKKMWYCSAIRNNDMWFEGKWMQLEDIVLSEVSQAQKYKGCMIFGHLSFTNLTQHDLQFYPFPANGII